MTAPKWTEEARLRLRSILRRAGDDGAGSGLCAGSEVCVRGYDLAVALAEIERQEKRIEKLESAVRRQDVP